MVMIDNPLRSRTFKRTNKSNAPYSLRKDHFLYYFIHEAIPTKIAATSTTTIQSMIQIDSNLTDTSDNNDLNNQVLAKPLRHSFNQYNKNIPPTIILQRLRTILSFINPQQNSLRTNSRSNFSTNNINKNTVGGSRSNSSAWSVSNAIPTKIAATSTTTIQSMIQIDSNLTDTSDNNDLNNQVLAKPLRHSFNQYNKNIPPTIILQRLRTILSFINPQQNSLRTNSRSNFSTNNINKNTVGGSRSNSSAWSVSNDVLLVEELDIMQIPVLIKDFTL
ncbi:hypothetical protein Glove_168g2 [Diversispora epigaea]|uniref:Uncharacterized protein n=1 Tax=Diversispora epigaea TaxID=1348612 RepID=A0A397IPN3_9GLOM|nr:hypothetical protein Glove_168g2 [Diversispora epigaea]